MRRTLIAALIVALAALVAVPGASAKPAKNGQSKTHTRTPHGPGSDTFERSANVRGKIRTKGAVVAEKAATTPAKIGGVRTWLGLDDVLGGFYAKNYKLRGKGEHIEVWSAIGTTKLGDVQGNALNFQAGDCRNGERTMVTKAQIDYLIDQFDNNIYPIESDVFSVPPDRDGHNARAETSLGVKPGYFGGDGDDIVVLIDNVRDDNFYDVNNTQEFSYIAGFFSSGLNNFFNRNVMTIDGYDWLHRTGQNPPNDPVPGDPCTSAPARPSLYEGVFAHEYQHLLLSYVDPPEATWINEGTSDIAIALTGYGHPEAPITDLHFDSHIQCFLGNNAVQTDANPNPRPGGPENSLNQWGDQNFDHEQEILCDYGAAYSFLLWLGDTYGDDVYHTLHNDADHQGFDAIQAILDDVDPGMTVAQAIDIWQATMALDAVIDDGATLTGGDADLYSVNPRLHAAINWETGAPDNDAYDTPGAPPNGGDFVRLMDDQGGFLNAGDVGSIDFQGEGALPTLPKTWTVDNAPPSGADGPALHSPVGDNLNDVIVRNVAVPAGSPELTFDAAWDLEDTFDFGYAQITTDGGESYTSLECTDTVDDTDPALGNVGPGFGQGFNGQHTPATFAPQTCDLTPYAGQTVGLAFRVYNDGGVHFTGFWVDNVAIDGTVISSGDDLDAWQSATEYNPVEVEGYTVQLLSYDSAGGGDAFLFSLPLDASFHGELTGADVAAAIGSGNDVVAAIVTYHDSTQLVTQYAPYELTVNGVTQPGGGE